MDLAKNPRPLKVLVVTKNRAVQRRLSRFLVMVRYHVLQAADAHSASSPSMPSRPTWRCWAATWPLPAIGNCATSCHNAKAPPACSKSSWSRIRTRRNCTRRFEAGIDDVLPEPIECGELLARLRGRARLGVRPSGGRARAARRGDGAAGPIQFGAAAEGTDHARPRRDIASRLRGDRHRFFWPHRPIAGRRGRRGFIAGCRSTTRTSRDGRPDRGLFGGRSLRRHPARGERSGGRRMGRAARAELAAAKFKLAETVWQITASFGIAAGEAAAAPELIERATQALQTAKSSGAIAWLAGASFATTSTSWNRAGCSNGPRLATS